MPQAVRAVGSDLGISITGMSPFSEAKRTEVERERTLAQLNSKRKASESEASPQDEVNGVKFPVVANTASLTSEANDDLEILLRVRCFDFPLQVRGLMPGANGSGDKTTQGKELNRADERESTQERSDQNGVDPSDEDDEPDDSVEDMNLLDGSPLASSTVLAGQRVNLKENAKLKRQSTQSRCQTTNKENTPSYQTDSSGDARRKSLPKLVSQSKPLKKQDTRPVLHLPKVDKYDIIPKNIIDVKVCSVFKVNDVKASLIYSGYKDSWVPHRDRNFMKNASFFKALVKQPTVFLKQPSSLAEESIAAAIQSFEKSNADLKLPSVDAEVTRQEKKFVIRLPPIC